MPQRSVQRLNTNRTLFHESGRGALSPRNERVLVIPFRFLTTCLLLCQESNSVSGDILDKVGGLAETERFIH